MFKFMRGRRNPDDDDDDTSASDDAPMRGGSNASSSRGGGGGHQKQRQQGQGGRQVGRGTSIDRSTSSHQPSLLRRSNGVDKAHHRGGGNRSWMSDTCSETDGNETWTTTEGGECGPDSGFGSGCGDWSEDGSGEGGGGKAAPPPPTPVPPPPSRRGGGGRGAIGRANVVGADWTNGGISRGSGGGGGHGGGEEFMGNKNGRGRGLSRSNSLGDASPSPRGVPKTQQVATRGSARVIPPPPSLVKDAYDVVDGGDERLMKIKPPSIRGMPRTRQSKSLTRSDPTLMSSAPSSSSKSWGPDGYGGGGDGARVAVPAPIAAGEAMQMLAQSSAQGGERRPTRGRRCALRRAGRSQG